MTVSFFLKRNKDRKKAIREAITYGVSIVVIYVALGLIVSLLFGASALNALSTNAIFNILFCLLLVVFAASFFGAFEITLPSSWSNKIDQKSDETSGVLSIFLMAFTLSGYPEGEEGLAVEYVPSVSKVGYREELQCECKLDETKHYLKHIHPST